MEGSYALTGFPEIQRHNKRRPTKRSWPMGGTRAYEA